MPLYGLSEAERNRWVLEARSQAAGAPTAEAAEEQRVARMLSATAQVGGELTAEQLDANRRTARKALDQLIASGVTSGGDFERLSQIAQTGQEQKSSWFGRLLGWLDKPGQLVRYGIADLFDIGEGEHITGQAYLDILLGRNASLLQRYGPEVVGEDARMSGSQLLELGGWGQEDSGWGKFLRGVASVGTELLTDPLTYAGIAAMGMPRPALLGAFRRVNDDIVREGVALARQRAAGGAVRTLGRGEHAVEEAARQIEGALPAARQFVTNQAYAALPNGGFLRYMVERYPAYVVNAAPKIDEGLVFARAAEQVTARRFDTMAPRILARDWAHPDLASFVTYKGTPAFLRGGLHLSPVPLLWNVPEKALTIPGTRGLGKKISRTLFGRAGSVAGQDASGLRSILEKALPGVFKGYEEIAKAMDARSYLRGVMSGGVKATVIDSTEEAVTHATARYGSRQSIETIARGLADLVQAGQKAGWSERQVWQVFGNLPARMIQALPSTRPEAIAEVRSLLVKAGIKDAPAGLVDGLVGFVGLFRKVMADTHTGMVKMGVLKPNAKMIDYFPMVLTPEAKELLLDLARKGVVSPDQLLSELIAGMEIRRVAGGTMGEAVHAGERTFGAFSRPLGEEADAVLLDIPTLSVMLDENPDLAASMLGQRVAATLAAAGTPDFALIDDLNERLSPLLMKLAQDTQGVLPPKIPKNATFRVFDTNPITVANVYLRDAHRAIVERAVLQHLEDIGELTPATLAIHKRQAAWRYARLIDEKGETFLTGLDKMIERMKKAQGKASVEAAKGVTIRAGSKTVEIPAGAASERVREFFRRRLEILSDRDRAVRETSHRSQRLKRLLQDRGVDEQTAEVLSQARTMKEARTLMKEARDALNDSARLQAEAVVRAVRGAGGSLADAAARVADVQAILSEEKRRVVGMAGRVAEHFRASWAVETRPLTADVVLAATEGAVDMLGRLQRAVGMLGDHPAALEVSEAVGLLIPAVRAGDLAAVRSLGDRLAAAVTRLRVSDEAYRLEATRDMAVSGLRAYATTGNLDTVEREAVHGLADLISESDPTQVFRLLERASAPRVSPGVGSMDMLDSLVAEAVAERSGLSYNPYTGRIFKYGDPGVVVGGLAPSRTIPVEDFLKNPEGLTRQMAEDYREVLEQYDNTVVGLWFGPDGAVLDISEIDLDPFSAWRKMHARRENSVFVGHTGGVYEREKFPRPPTEVLDMPAVDAPAVSGPVGRALAKTGKGQNLIGDLVNATALAHGLPEVDFLRAGMSAPPGLVREATDLRDMAVALDWVVSTRQAVERGVGWAPGRGPVFDQVRLERGLRELLSIGDDLQVSWQRIAVRVDEGQTIYTWGPKFFNREKRGISHVALRKELERAGLTADQARRALLAGEKLESLAEPARQALLASSDETAALMDEWLEGMENLLRMRRARVGGVPDLPEPLAAQARAMEQVVGEAQWRKTLDGVRARTVGVHAVGELPPPRWVRQGSLEAKFISDVPIGFLEQISEYDRLGAAAIAGHGADRVARLAESIKTEGWRDPVIVELYFDPSGRVFAQLGEGNHRMLAAKQLGLEEVPAKVIVRSGPFGQRSVLSRPPVDVTEMVKRGLEIHPPGLMAEYWTPADFFGFPPSSREPSGVRAIRESLAPKVGDLMPPVTPAQTLTGRLFASLDRTSGVGVTADGEVFGLFNVGAPGGGMAALGRAVREGGFWAMVPDGNTEALNLFRRMGFTEQTRQGSMWRVGLPREQARAIERETARHARASAIVEQVYQGVEKGNWAMVEGLLTDRANRAVLHAQGHVDEVDRLLRNVRTRRMLADPAVSAEAGDLARASAALVDGAARVDRAEASLVLMSDQLRQAAVSPEMARSRVAREWLAHAEAMRAGFASLMDGLRGGDDILAVSKQEIEHFEQLRTQVITEADALGFKEFARSMRKTKLEKTMVAPDGRVLVKAYNLRGEMLDMAAPNAWVAQQLDSIVGHMQMLNTPPGLQFLAHQARSVVGWWKGMATVVRPTFHVRNLIGGTFNNMIGGVRVRDYLWVRDKVARFRHWQARIGTDRALGKMAPRDRTVIKAMLDEGVLESSFARADAQALVSPASRWSRMNPLSQHGPAVKVGSQVMMNVEDFLRAAAFRRWHDSMGSRMAAEMTWALHFDYRRLTPLESQIKKIVPFFVWTRRNLPLQLRALVERPDLIQRYSHLMHGMDDQYEPNAPYDFPLPGLYANALNIETGLVFNGDTPFWARAIVSPDLPVLDLGQIDPMSPKTWFSFLVSTMGPQITAPFQIGQAAEYGGSVNAPAGLNEILMGLHAIGLYDDTSGGVAQIPRELRTLIETGLPMWREWTSAWETDPARRQQVGLGEQREILSANVLRALGITFARGFGMRTATPTQTYNESWETQGELQNLVRELRRRGVIPYEP